jgi:hypothetical protein
MIGTRGESAMLLRIEFGLLFFIGAAGAAMSLGVLV